MIWAFNKSFKLKLGGGIRSFTLKSAFLLACKFRVGLILLISSGIEVAENKEKAIIKQAIAPISKREVIDECGD